MSTDAYLNERYELAGRIIDPVSGVLQYLGEQRHLRRRELEVLALLAAADGLCVHRQDFINHIWHGNGLTGEQALTDTICALRRSLQDKDIGHLLIRTIPRQGYQLRGVARRLGTCSGTVDADSARAELLQTSTALDFASLSTQARVPPGASARSAGSQASWILRVPQFAMLVLAISLGWALHNIEHWAPFQHSREIASAVQQSVTSAANDPISELREALYRGESERVRTGLSQLPKELADTIDAGALAVELDIARGRFRSAEDKLAALTERTNEDIVGRANVRIIESDLHARSNGAYGPSDLLSASEAVVLLENSGQPQVLARALHARGRRALVDGKLDAAVEDFARASELFLTSGNQRGALRLSSAMAAIWMRQGRLREALEQVLADAEACAAHGFVIDEIFLRNRAVRIQIALLHWNDALSSSDRAIGLLQKIGESERRHRVLELRSEVLIGLGRFREAESTLDEAGYYKPHPSVSTARILLALNTGRWEIAMELAALAFDAPPSRNASFLYESRDGSLLLWTIAAQKLVERGDSVQLPPNMLLALEEDDSILLRIARGRWHSFRGDSQVASSKLETELQDLQVMQHPHWFLHACTALIDAQRAAEDYIAAQTTLSRCKAHSSAVAKDRTLLALENQLLLASLVPLAGQEFADRPEFAGMGRNSPAPTR